MTAALAPYSTSSPAYLERLTAFFRPYFALLPNYRATELACRPIAGLATAWQRDELAGWGSYTSIQVPGPARGRCDVEHDARPAEAYGALPPSACETPASAEEVVAGRVLDRDIEALRHGIPERGLWIAGEHTAPFAALGTVTGAWQSGEMVGRRVVEWYEGKGEGNTSEQ